MDTMPREPELAGVAEHGSTLRPIIRLVQDEEPGVCGGEA